MNNIKKQLRKELRNKKWEILFHSKCVEAERYNKTHEKTPEYIIFKVAYQQSIDRQLYHNLHLLHEYGIYIKLRKIYENYREYLKYIKKTEKSLDYIQYG